MELQENVLREIHNSFSVLSAGTARNRKAPGSDDFASHIVTKAVCSRDGFINAVRYFKG